eukprot:CAMPEP_0170880804 /NCGR_PEP_ID=MMETSP0734-20130129/32659_1 /TAXON_ID=186038 /ORGANISM="Fragilariopsis kerguelensis, Strain L26-C5" /LENGTH=719 /DNA_ID=CAMNT_0011264409 /DNA_START=13 /DNA_END=2172 /DNA_ORIENTATION=+
MYTQYQQYNQYQNQNQQKPSSSSLERSAQGMEWNGTSWIQVQSQSQLQSQSYNNNNNNNSMSNTTNTFSSQLQTSPPPNQVKIPPHPVQTYTQYYHGWTKRAKELSRSLTLHNGNNNHEIENNHQWAKYYAEESSRAAHHFHQHPQATSAPFTLPPAPPKNSNDTNNNNQSISVSTTAMSSSSTTGNSAGSVTRYVKRNMERHEVQSDAEMKKRVQAEIEKQIAVAIQEGKFQFKNWDEVPLIALGLQPQHGQDASESKNSNSSINSSSYRTKPVRASNTHFCPPNRINDEMECVFQQMEMYAEARWRSGAAAAAAATNNTVYVYNAISMAAIWMYAIANVHPFRDGNGRLSRIICNYVLKRLLKMPFVITLVATPQQRKEFIESMKFGQIIIRQLSSSSATTAISGFDSDNMFDIDTPIFLKLIDTILDRLSHAIHQFQALLREKSSAAEAQREAKIIRKYRVRAANGQCIICLDDKPNIATLCCGQAVHLNCIAEWLSNQQSCVSCRSPLPRLVGVTNNNNNSNNVDYEENQEEEEDSIENINDDTTYDSDTTSDVQQVVDTSDYDTTNDITEDTTEETTDDPAPLPTQDQDQHQPSRCNICNNMSATNCSNGLCGRCCVNHGAFNCNRHHVAQEQQSDTTDDEDTNMAEGTIDDTTENTTCSDDSVPAPVPVQQQQQSSRCNVCNNRSAMNCSNGLCGRCCVNLGVIYCDRHHASL